MAKATLSYRIFWRPTAEADLEDIVDHIAQDNPIRAQAFGQELRDKTSSLLAAHPKLGRSGRPGLPAFARELVVHRHYIMLYRVLADAHTVEILRVKHTAQRTP